MSLFLYSTFGGGVPKSEQKGNGGLGNAHTNIRSKRKFLHIIKTFIVS